MIKLISGIVTMTEEDLVSAIIDYADNVHLDQITVNTETREVTIHFHNGDNK